MARAVGAGGFRVGPRHPTPPAPGLERVARPHTYPTAQGKARVEDPPHMPKFVTKGVVDGKEVDVELDDSVVLPRDQHQTILETTIENRLGRQKRALRETFLSDEEFVA